MADCSIILYLECLKGLIYHFKKLGILYFYETAAWNHFILYMHISLGGLFNICENGGGGSMHPLKNYGGFCVIPLNAFNYITIWQTVL